MKTIEVVAAIIKKDDKIFITKRSYGEFIDMWEFPGGKIEAGESREDALQREIKEELELDIKNLEYLTTVEYDYPTFHLIMHCYICEICGGKLALNAHNDAKWVSVSELKNQEWIPADIDVVEAIIKKNRSEIMKVNLNDVIESIEFEGDLLTHYYNKNTGIIMYVEDASTATYKAEDIENIENFEEWEQELIRALNDLKENPQDYIQLPDQNELDEYKMMVEFCKTIGGIEIKDNIRQLKDEIESKGYINNWYDYREETEHNIAKAWCEKNNISY